MWWHISIIVSPNTDNIYVLVHGYWCRDTLKTSIADIWYWLHSSNLFVGKTSLAQAIVPIEIIISWQLYLSGFLLKDPWLIMCWWMEFRHVFWENFPLKKWQRIYTQWWMFYFITFMWTFSMGIPYRSASSALVILANYMH